MENVSMNTCEQRIAKHLFDPRSWVKRAGDNLALARYYQNQVAPLAHYRAGDFDTFSRRLVLLDDAQWQILGFSVALAPFAGSIEKNLNGSLRRAAKSVLSGDAIEQLDQLQNQSLPTFLLAPDCWANVQEVSLCGIASILNITSLTLEQDACMNFRFEAAKPAVENLTLSLVEVLCKISLPTQTWLFEAAQSH
jgi:hypothetical protein